MGWVGTASKCVFCLGAKSISWDEARRYDSFDPLYGAEPTLRRIKILVYQMDAYDRSRELLEQYGFTLERLTAELDEDELDRLWGFDGRNLAGRDFSEPLGRLAERWDECDFSGSTLTGANFHDVVLADANFDGADLTGATLDGAVLCRADLTEVNLTGASLRGASLVGANLRDTNFVNTNVTEADFRGAKGLESDALGDLRARGGLVDDPAG